jgi:hypothetical protein
MNLKSKKEAKILSWFLDKKIKFSSPFLSGSDMKNVRTKRNKSSRKT